MTGQSQLEANIPKIVVVDPVVCDDHLDLGSLTAVAGGDVTLVERGLTEGPAAIGSERDGALAAPHVVDLCIEAEQSGADAIAINCMGDPGLHAAREVTSIPIVGAGEAAIQWGAALGRRIGWLGIPGDRLDAIQRQFDLPALRIASAGF